jgi:monooxygenase
MSAMPSMQEFLTAEVVEGGQPTIDVLIIGAGIAGLGCAAYLRREMPAKTWAILEMRDDLGGTWDFFKYPGVRSDSDLYTMGYEFKPWRSEKAIAGAAAIKEYLDETADEYDIRRNISFGRKVVRAEWSSADASWIVTAEDLKTGAHESYRCRWIFSATGYYDYEHGYRPAFPEEESFKGPIVHPQHWPEDLDYAGKRIAVIGSGATAVTLLPALAEKAAHVTQVQRTPSYVLPVPQVDPLLRFLRPFFSEERVHRILRRKNVYVQHVSWALCKKYPNLVRKLIRRCNRKALTNDYPVDVHYNPPYDPGDQRVCGADSNLYKALNDGSCSIVTGRIERFTETGISMASGEQVDADIIVTATGLNLKILGGVEVFVDGEKVNCAERIAFKSMMLDGVPNLVYAFGSVNSSWSLKIGLVCIYFCRLMKEMDRRGVVAAMPERPARPMETRPLLEFGAGYLQRAINILPRQGDSYPWQNPFNYPEDEKMLKRGKVIEPELKLFPAPAVRLPQDLALTNRWTEMALS